jgi:hypothetical protein
VVTQRYFGPTRSLAARSAATLKVAASGAAHERLIPTGGRAGRVVRIGQERGVRGGLGRGGEPRRRCEVAGRAQAGGANTACVQGHCARARVGGALTFRLDIALLARRQRQDEVDPVGLDVRGRGECPDPAARYPADSLAQLARAPSPAPARSRTTILSLSRGQAANGYLTRRLTEPGRDEEHLLEARQPRGSSSPSTCYRPEQPELVLVRVHGCSPPPARGEKALNFRWQKSFKKLRRGGGGNEVGSYLMRTAVRACRKPAAQRFWAALGLQRALLELPFVGLGQQAGHLCAACRSGSTS